jgi:hypothetical protein
MMSGEGTGDSDFDNSIERGPDTLIPAVDRSSGLKLTGWPQGSIC